MPGVQIQPQPGLELAEPEIRLVPDDRKIAEAGWTRTELATAIRAMGDGAFLGEYFDGTRRFNVVLRAEHWYSPEELGKSMHPFAIDRARLLSNGMQEFLFRLEC
mgnify:CR=1 FL=1